MTVETMSLTTGAMDAAEPPAEISWHSFDLRSGRRGPRLDVQRRGTVGRIINEPTEGEQTVLIWKDDAPVLAWDPATLPGRTTLVALDADDQPIWEGMVLRRVTSGDVWATLSLATLEAYLDRRYTRDLSFVRVDESLIVEGIIADVATDGIELTVDAPLTGQKRTRHYLEDEDKTALSVLQDLAGIRYGIEFTIDTRWADATHTRLERVLRVRNRLGTASDHPTAAFSMPGSVVDFQYVEDYTSDKGANAVQAVSSGEGESRPESPWLTVKGLIASGWARFERKFTPSSSITDVATLRAHAASELTETWAGVRELTLEANLDEAPKAGTDWDLGDNIAVSLTCPRFPERTNADGAIVPGYQGIARCIGWEIDFDERRVKPRLLEVDEIAVTEL